MRRTLALPSIGLTTLKLNARALADLLRATCNLAWARREIGSATPNALLQRQTVCAAAQAEDRGELVKRVAIAIPRAASRVPWRSDCLVQAIAAERWLASMGVPTVLFIGARKDEHSQFLAHAWLTVGDTIVTGGNIREYATLIGDRGTRSKRD